MFGAIAGAGGAVGLLLGGLLTEYLSWRWTLYVNLIFAGLALVGGALLLRRQQSSARPRLDIPGVVLVSSAMFCLVYGFSNAASHSWATPSTYGFLAVGVALLAAFAAWQVRAAHPLLPPHVVLDRDRSGAYLSMLFVSAGLFGTFLFLTYYLQQTLGYSPLVTGVAFLPLSAGIVVAANLSTIVLMPRIGPRPLVAFGLLAAAGGAVWLAQLAPHTGYAAGVLGPTIVSGIGIGMVFAPSINAGTGPGRAGAGARLHHRILVDRRDLRRRRGHLRCPGPQRVAGSAGRAVPGTGRGAGRGRPRRPGMIPLPESVPVLTSECGEVCTDSGAGSSKPAAVSTGTGRA